jgi:UDP-3-O-[3-hydroxymyristoyl] glucosamine N-acyltransferase
MRFSQLLSHLSEVQAAGGPHGLSHSLADDPELQGAAALDQSGSGELSFLEPGNALAAALGASGASAVLLPARADEA